MGEETGSVIFDVSLIYVCMYHRHPHIIPYTWAALMSSPTPVNCRNRKLVVPHICNVMNSQMKTQGRQQINKKYLDMPGERPFKFDKGYEGVQPLVCIVYYCLRVDPSGNGNIPVTAKKILFQGSEFFTKTWKKNPHYLPQVFSPTTFLFGWIGHTAKCFVCVCCCSPWPWCYWKLLCQLSLGFK